MEVLKAIFKALKAVFKVLKKVFKVLNKVVKKILNKLRPPDRQGSSASFFENTLLKVFQNDHKR